LLLYYPNNSLAHNQNRLDTQSRRHLEHTRQPEQVNVVEDCQGELTSVVSCNIAPVRFNFGYYSLSDNILNDLTVIQQENDHVD
jgi:hypothetical protein